MPASSSVKLNTGAEIPTVGLGTYILSIVDAVSYKEAGTWKSKPGQVEHAVEFALRHGYRHIDGAAGYGNEKEVGKGIKESGVPRGDIFLTTKLDNPDHKNAAAALETSLKKLDTDYLDLCRAKLTLILNRMLTFWYL